MRGNIWIIGNLTPENTGKIHGQVSGRGGLSIQLIYTLGEGENTITTNYQIIKFNENIRALLVRQRGGSEHYKRWYYLFEIQDQQFNLVWNKTDRQGPFLTDVIVSAPDSNESELIYLEGISFQGYNDKADSLRLVRLY